MKDLYHGSPCEVDPIVCNSFSKGELETVGTLSKTVNSDTHLAISHHGSTCIQRSPLSFCNIKKFKWAFFSISPRFRHKTKGTTHFISKEGQTEDMPPLLCLVSVISEEVVQQHHFCDILIPKLK